MQQQGSSPRPCAAKTKIPKSERATKPADYASSICPLKQRHGKWHDSHNRSAPVSDMFLRAVSIVLGHSQTLHFGFLEIRNPPMGFARVPVACPLVATPCADGDWSLGPLTRDLGSCIPLISRPVTVIARRRFGAGFFMGVLMHGRGAGPASPQQRDH